MNTYVTKDIDQEMDQVHQSADEGDTPLTIIVDRKERSRLRLEVSGELDLYTAPRLEQVLEDACAPVPDQIILDFLHLDFIDSAGLALILGLYRRFSAPHPSLRLLVPPEGQVREVLALSHFDRYFHVEYTDQATQSE